MLGITVFLVNVSELCFFGLAVFDAILALNRTKVMFDVNYPAIFDYILQLSVWLLAITTAVISIFGLTGFQFSDDFLSVVPDFSLPWEATYEAFSAKYGIVCTLVALLCYIVIILKILYDKSQTRHGGLNILEKNILIFAFIKFIGDLVCALSVQLATLAQNNGGDESLVQKFGLASGYLYMVVVLCLPPVLFLALNK
ncbi:hypothetical protein L596_026928 [Steinernema carpocapsae]|uniref:7TM GPCR serpentine receptor class x (Srx) domain-containing protein n=1 Tax=Steinernema carpocapsae TaxID=34508 RepID=A0A4V5ZYB5_STECR|nr:hypothetical protein L596_026928 [Steinernema carpocapsae]